MEATVQWEHDLHFVGWGDGPLRVPLQGGGVNSVERQGLVPLQLILLGLAGCTGMDVIAILRKKGQRVTDFSVAVEASQADRPPRVFTHLTINYRVTGSDVDPRAVERAIELSSTRFCPATAMLRPIASIEHTFEVRPDR